MSARHAQLVLAAIFVGALLLHLASFAYAFRSGAIYVEDLKTLTVRVLAIYSVPLGVIAGGMFARSGKPPAGRASTLWTAAALSLLWNFLLVSRSLLFALSQQDSIAGLLDYMETVAAGGTFLISAALAYYYAK